MSSVRGRAVVKAPRGVARRRMMGLSFAALTRREVMSVCLDLCLRPLPARARFVVPVNASLCAMLRDDPALRRACQTADLVVADGMSIVWTLRRLGTPLPERVAGIDLMEDLLKYGAAHGLRVYFLGARPEVVRRMVEVCLARFPGLVAAGWRDGYFGPEQSDEVTDAVRASGAQLLLLAMPSPRKEIWAHANLKRFGVQMVLPVGGSFDVLSGRILRAPFWMQERGLEWVWRVIQEPRTYGMRYLRGNAVYAALVWQEWRGRRAAVRLERRP